MSKSMCLSDTVISDAKVLWDYHRLLLPLQSADVLLGLGSYDPKVAEHAADLFLEGWAEWLMFTGGVVDRNDLLKTPWRSSEAEVFREIAIERGVPKEKILLECNATNTSENLRFSVEKLQQSSIEHESLIIVTKPNMERRVRATAGVALSNSMKFSVTSRPCSFEEDCLMRFDPFVIINLMVGDLQRIDAYPILGFQKYETIPQHVRLAWKRLISAGFTKHLISSTRQK